MIFKRLKKNIIKQMTRAILALAFVVLIVALWPAQETKADYVTDWLEVRVGYPGMELSEYVLVDKFHFSDFESGIIPLYTVSYSYFQGDGQTDDNGIYWNSSYRSIVATGWGFYITDLLDYCKIYYGDIYNLLFYVNDHNTIWTALDKDSLFRQRYYFNDVPGHRITQYNDFYQVLGYDFSPCWDDCIEVQPMLALESNWDSVNEYIEHHEGTEVGMSTSTRFRLLYGQLAPTERITRESAEYVSCLYVTLNGKAEYGEMPELSNELGSHTVEMQVSTDNASIRNALSELMQINSTNENVLVIKGFTITESDVYSDIATISIEYEIVGEGDASISASIGQGANAQVNTIASTPKETEPSSQAAEETETTASEAETQKETSASGSSPSGVSGDEANDSSDSGDVTAADIQNDDSIDAEEIEVVDGSGAIVYKLADGVISNMNELIDTDVSVPADQDISQVVVEDNTEEEEAEKRLILILTGAGALALCIIGFMAGLISFKLRLKYKNGFPEVHPGRAIGKFFFGNIYTEDK